MNDTRQTKSLIALAFVAAFVVRLAFGLVYWTDRPLTKDENEYLSLARSLAAGHGFVYDAALPGGTADAVGRAPAYPVFLALTGGGNGAVRAVPTSVKAAQALVGALGVLTIAAISLQLAGPGAAVAAALLAAVYPPLVWVASYAWSEAVAWPLGMLAVWLFDVVPTSAGRRESLIRIGTGLVIGLTILVRPGSILFLLAATLWLGKRGRWQTAAWIVAGTLAVLGPWSARNYLEYGHITFVASEGGVTFWTGNHPLANGDGDLSSNPALRADDYRLKSQHPGRTDEELERVYYREAFAWIREHPVDWLALEIRKAFYIVVPVGPSYAQHSTRYAAASIASYVLILPFAAAGFRRLGAARRRAPGLWLLAGSSIVMALIFFPQERFRIPVLDPALIICSSALLMPRTRLTSARAATAVSTTGPAESSASPARWRGSPR
jgi:hypothetical protein